MDNNIDPETLALLKRLYNDLAPYYKVIFTCQNMQSRIDVFLALGYIEDGVTVIFKVVEEIGKTISYLSGKGR